MNADDLDTRIRAMVRDAVDAAPPAPELPLDADVRADGPRGPRWMWAGIGIAAAVAAAAVLVLTTRGDDSSTVVAPTDPETTAVTESTGGGTVDPTAQPWPDGVAVIVASERGIERVTAENGQAVVTRVLSGVKVERAFELDDGTILYQEYLGDIRAIDAKGAPIGDAALVTSDGSLALQDADAPDGDLRLVYRTSTEVPEFAGQVWAWFQPDSRVTTAMPGGFGVGYRRFTIVDHRTVMASTIDDTGQRSSFTFSFGDGEQLAPGFEQPYFVIGDGAGTYVALTEAGTIEWTGVRSGSVGGIDDPRSVIEMDTRGDWLTLQRQDGESALVDLTQGTTYALPVAGGGANISVSRKDHAPSTGVPTTTPTTPSTAPSTAPSTSVGTTPSTTVGATLGDPFPSCLTVTTPPPPGVGVGTRLYTFEELPQEDVVVDGRPAVLRTWGESHDVTLSNPDWCTELGIVADATVSLADFRTWLSTVDVVETLPASMPPVLLRSTLGVSVVTAEGTRTVHRGAVDQALLLADGKVVYHAEDLADFQIWDPVTGSSEAIWAAADWIETPILHDAFGDSFVFSVADRLYQYDMSSTDSGRRWPLSAPPTQRISVFGDGELLATPDSPAAMDPSGEQQVSTLPGGVVSVLRFPDGAILFQSVDSDMQVTDVDINDGWLAISRVPPGDSPVRVDLVEIATGRWLQFDAVEGAHLG